MDGVWRGSFGLPERPQCALTAQCSEWRVIAHCAATHVRGRPTWHVADAERSNVATKSACKPATPHSGARCGSQRHGGYRNQPVTAQAAQDNPQDSQLQDAGLTICVCATETGFHAPCAGVVSS